MEVNSYAGKLTEPAMLLLSANTVIVAIGARLLAHRHLFVSQLYLYGNVLLDSGAYSRGRRYKCFDLNSKGTCI